MKTIVRYRINGNTHELRLEPGQFRERYMTPLRLMGAVVTSADVEIEHEWEAVSLDRDHKQAASVREKRGWDCG